ncbi:MAG: ribonuclease III [Alphaproteobacteria bacterium]
MEDKATLKLLAAVLKHDFKNPAILIEALTHPSAANLGHRKSYERLEFLGDRVLGLVVAEMLLQAYPEESEGDIARRHTGLVRREAATLVAEQISLGRYLRMSKGEAEAGSRDSPAILADAIEAVIAALYLDGGLDCAARFIADHWTDLMMQAVTPPMDAKTALQEWVQQRGLDLPRYEVVGREGPSHAPEFTIRVVVEAQPEIAASGSSKRAAEQRAAAEMLNRLAGRPHG